MTREEAIEVINDVMTDAVYQILSEEKEALQMAIKALSQEPCTDAVSREAVINIVKLRWDYYKNCIEAIEKLPSVNPQPCYDVISRDDRLLDLANAIESDDSGYWTNKRISSALRNIEKLPSVTQKSIVSDNIREEVEQLPSVMPRTNCQYRHENGNCLKVGGFCTSVDDKHCLSVTQKPIECPLAIDKRYALCKRTITKQEWDARCKDETDN